MIKRGFVFSVILLVLIISGCNQFPTLPNSLPNFQNIGQGGKQITESRGLSIQFKDSQPPLDEIYAGKNFKVSLDVTNNDPTDISGTISLSDTPSDEYSSLKGKEQQSFALQPAEVIENKVIPTKEILTFGPFQYDNSKVFQGMLTNFIVELSTNHKTSITSQVCIKGSSQESKCPNKETITNLGNQAKYSPVTITKIEKNVVPQEEGLLNLNLKIYLKNTGKGKIDNEDESISNFKVSMQGSANLDCINLNKISLKDGEKVIICNTDLSISDEVFRQDVLEIYFEYPYKIIETLGPIKVTKIN